MREITPWSLPGLTRQSILFRRAMDARVIRAFTPVFDGLCPRMTTKDRGNAMKKWNMIIDVAYVPTM